jgi:hypothetical protein
MIFSKDHNFLLIKNMKVGSTSLEVEISKILPESAIVTAINPSNINHLPRNCAGFRNHEPFSSASKKLDLSNVVSYTFVRNPYECVLSDFFFNKEIRSISKKWDDIPINDRNKIVNKYFNKTVNDKTFMKSTKDLYTDGKNILVTHVLRYENGLEEINNFLPNHNLPKIKVNTFEKAYRPKHITYHDVFNKNQIEQIQEEWFWEFDNLGYNR